MNSNRIVLKLGEWKKVKHILFHDTRIIYAGMVNDHAYSIVITDTKVHNSLSYNVYFDRHQKEIATRTGKLLVHSVSKDSFEFEFLN